MRCKCVYVGGAIRVWRSKHSVAGLDRGRRGRAWAGADVPRLRASPSSHLCRHVGNIATRSSQNTTNDCMIKSEDPEEDESVGIIDVD